MKQIYILLLSLLSLGAAIAHNKAERTHLSTNPEITVNLSQENISPADRTRINTISHTGFAQEIINIPVFESASLAGNVFMRGYHGTEIKCCIENTGKTPYQEAANKLSGNFRTDCYNFDDLEVGAYVAEQLGGSWTTWNGTPGGDDDALVRNEQSHSPENSFLVSEGVDLVFELGEEAIDSGAWLYSNYIYVPSGFSGYFNVQSDPVPGEEWVIELYFDDDGTGYFEGGSADTFEYTHDTWILVEINFDLDTDLAQVFIDGNLITQFENTFTIGGVDFWASDSGGIPGAFYDDVCFGEGTPISNDNCYNFDDLEAGEFLALQLGGMWTTWTGSPGGDDDGFVSNDQSHTPNNSFVVFENIIDLIFKLDEEPIDTGAWLYSHYMYVASGATAYFNVQSSPIPGEEWVIELFFDDDGTGYFEGGSADTFEYTPDTWILIEINFDLDSDLAEIYFDGEKITQFSNEFTIGGINYYGDDGNGEPEAYYDDVCFGEGWPLTVGIKEKAIREEVRIFPNPATNQISISSASSIKKLEFFNQLGQLIKSYNTDSKVVNISDLKEGIYIMKISFNDQIVTKKLVIE